MSVDVRIEVNPAWPAELRAAVSTHLHRLGADIHADAARMVPVKTGKLRASLYYETDGLNLKVGVRDVDYWMTVEFGSGPHRITPVTKKALYWPGARHPVAFVNHPGTPAQPFLRPALYRRRGAV